MYRCTNCGTNIDEYQHTQFNGRCPDCVRLEKKVSNSSDTRISRELRIHTLEKRKSDLGGATFLIFAVPSAPLVMAIVSIAEPGGPFPTTIAYFVLLIISAIIVLLLSLVVKYFKAINEELKVLEK